MHILINKYAQYMHKYTASVVGARGYTGIETAKLLLSHPSIQLTKCFATSDFSLSKLIFEPGVESVQCFKESELMQNLTDYVFLATPAEVSLELAPKLVAAGCKVIDLSGAFRLKKNDYQKWYAFQHNQPELLASANYGLVPWAQPTKSNLISNPGCYASAISMALIPLLKENLILADSIVIDAKSGTSGAGKKASENLLFTEASEDCTPYRIGKHQHLPEIQETLEQFTGVKAELQLSTYLLPVRRGIIAGIYAKANAGVTLSQIQNAFTKAYDHYPLVKHGTTTEKPELLSLKSVVNSGRTHITYHLEGNQLYIYSTIDNLMKGAASQAIENLNRLLDLPIHTGLH